MMGLLPNTAEKDLHAILKRDFFRANEEIAFSASVLKIKLPPAGTVEDGGCTTPKAADHEKNVDIIVPRKCPPPPRKPKSVPSRKRKPQRLLLDLSSEIDALFPASFVCGKVKKVRRESL